MTRASAAFPVLVLTPPAGRSRAETWLARAQRAAAVDLVRVLQETDGVGPLYALSAEPDDRAILAAMGATPLEAGPGAFHFGEVLTRFSELQGGGRMAYFGGASAPLLTAESLAEAFAAVRRADGPQAMVNNLYSSDWIILSQSRMLAGLTKRLPTDNQLGWVLSREAGCRVEAFPPSAESRADIDTPADLLLLQGHPRLGRALGEALADGTADPGNRVGRLRQLVTTPGETLGIIGRASSHIWGEIERRTSIWVRLFAEERGMVASGRVDRGEVRSLIAMAVEAWGAGAFIERMAELVGGLIWDTRVWMSHRGPWPTSADRCASDLGWADDVGDPALRQLTQAAIDAPIPVLLGGHGVVSGGLYAFLEAIEGVG